MEFNERHEMVLESRPETAISTYTYDSMGDPLTMRDPEQRLMSYAYDVRQRKVSETNGENETTSYTYDLNNNQIQKTRPEGNQWQYDYDELNRLVKIIDANSQESAYAYDRQNNLNTQIDANGNVTRYEYDVLNRKALKRYPITAQGAAICRYDYDPNNNLLVKTDANGQIDTHSYDALNRLTNKTYGNSQVTLGRDMTREAMTYDGNNNVLSVAETYSLTSGGTEVRTDTKTYDDFDRLFNRTDSFTKTIRYGYDLNGNRTRLTDSDGIITTYRFDGLNRVKDVMTQQGITAYQYDRSSLLKQTTYPNNTTASYRYDQAKRSTRIHNQQNNATVSNYEYVFDNNGNRVEQRETNGGAQELTTYRFDLNDRLLEVAYDVQGCTSVPNAGCVGGTPNVTTSYTYDAAYNRTSEVDTTISGVTKNKTYRYNPRNQLTNVDDNLDNANSATYAFDQNGNQIQKVKQSQTTNFVFDIRDDLREVKIGGSTVGQFLYDYQGLRIEKLGERGAERNTYDGQSILQQYNVAGCTTVGDANCAVGTTGQTRAKFDYGANSLLSLNAQGEPTQFYLYDVLNSVANLTNSDGAVQARYQYDAWGIKRNQVGTSYNRFSFTGYEEDTETGLLYAKARYLDPDSGRFLSQDAWEGDNRIAPSSHKYLYAYQNPTVYVDLDGNFPVTQQIRDFFRNQAANQARTSRGLTGNLGDGFFSDLGVRGLNAASGIGNALFSVAGEAVNLVDLGLDSGVGSSRMLSNTKVGQESRARVKGTREFLKNTATTAASKTYSAVKEKGFIGATGDAIGSSVSKTGDFLHKAYISGDLEAGAKLTGGLYTAAVPGAAFTKVARKGGGKTKLVGESDGKITPVDVPNAEGYMGNGSFMPSGSTVHHGKHSTAIGSDDATLGNFKQATNTGNGHNVIVHGERRYDNNGGAFSVDGQPTNSQQIVDAVKGNSNYKEGSPVCLGSCWSGSNGTAQEVANGLKAPVTAPTVPTRFNDSRNKWELMSDDQLPLDVDFIPEWKAFTPEKR